MVTAAIAGLGMGATVAGGAVSAAGGILGGLTSSAAYNYQAGVAQLNAQIAQQNAHYALEQGESQAQQQGMKVKAQVGATRAQEGASGLALGSGTGQQVISSEIELGQYDQASVRYTAQQKAYGFKVEAADDEAQASLDQYSANNALISGGINAFGSVLGTAGSFSNQWLQASKIGMNPFTTGGGF